MENETLFRCLEKQGIVVYTGFLANAAKSRHWGNKRIYALKKTYDSLAPRPLHAFQTAIIRAHWNEVKLMIETVTNAPPSAKGEERYTHKPSP